MPLGRLAALAVVLVGCAKKPVPPPPASTPSPPDAPVASGAPAVLITSPAEGDSTGPRVMVHLSATGVRVVPASGLRVPGEGHHHLFLDIDPGAADSIIGKGKGIFHLGTGVDSLLLDSLPPGGHRLIAVFAGGDHVPMAEVRRDTVSFSVRKP